MTGILIKLNDRPCGECLSVFKENVGWVPVRLEFTDDWVLVDDGRAKTFPVPYGDRVML